MAEGARATKGSAMTSIKFAVAAFVTASLAAAPFAAEAKKQRSGSHHITHVVAPTYSSPSVTAAQPRPSYGSSGQTVGTVTAPSIGTYSWPSVGVTNSVPTWSNTNPK